MTTDSTPFDMVRFIYNMSDAIELAYVQGCPISQKAVERSLESQRRMGWGKPENPDHPLRPEFAMRDHAHRFCGFCHQRHEGGFSVGDGATSLHYSDQQAHTVIEVSANGKRIKVQRDKAVLLNGVKSGAEDALHFEPGGFCGHTSGTQRYRYERDPEGAITEYSLRKNGRWVLKGDTARGQGLVPGRSEHYDYNF